MRGITGIALALRDARKKTSRNLDSLIAGDMTPRQGTCQESSSVRPKDSGYKANSIAFRNNTFRVMEVNLRLALCSGGENDSNAGRDEIPPLVPRFAELEQCDGKSEMRKSDSGTGRSDRQASETGDTPRRTRPFHVHSKCAASPCCRTIRNARTRYNRREPPRRKSESRKHGSARGAALPLPQGSP